MGESILTSVNFAVNDRIYCPDNNRRTHQGTNVTDRNGYQYQESFCQYGYPLVHENRCVGRAIYALDLEYLNKDQTVLAGISTTMLKPFELTLEYQQDTTTDWKNLTGSLSTSFQDDSEMIPFLWFDYVIAVNTAGVTVIGRS